MPGQKSEDSAARRNTLHIWQELGRGAARNFWNERGIIYPRVPKNRKKAMQVAYVDGWNSEMRVIRATRMASVDNDELCSIFER